MCCLPFFPVNGNFFYPTNILLKKHGKCCFTICNSKSTNRLLQYNAAQRIALYLNCSKGIGSLLTGLAIYKPVQFKTITWLCGGYKAARAEHFILTIGYVLFFLVHIVQVAKTGWNNFQAIITGFEIFKTTPQKSEHEKD